MDTVLTILLRSNLRYYHNYSKPLIFYYILFKGDILKTSLISNSRNCKICFRLKTTKKRWQYRQPPDGCIPSQLMLCIMPQPCVFQDNCPNAHSEGELEEWKSRYIINDQVIKYSTMIP